MITAWWIFAAFAAGACGGVFLNRRASGAGRSRRRNERDECDARSQQGEDRLVDARLPVPLYVLAAAALLG